LNDDAGGAIATCQNFSGDLCFNFTRTTTFASTTADSRRDSTADPATPGCGTCNRGRTVTAAAANALHKDGGRLPATSDNRAGLTDADQSVYIASITTCTGIATYRCGYRTTGNTSTRCSSPKGQPTAAAATAYGLDDHTACTFT
jgi:hypothetical protein